MKRILLSLLICFPILLWAQEDNSKYLAGAVPVVNGKVIFTEHIQAPGLSKQQVYDVLLKWAEKRFAPSKGQKGGLPILIRKEGRLHVWVKNIFNYLQPTVSFWIVLPSNIDW